MKEEQSDVHVLQADDKKVAKSTGSEEASNESKNLITSISNTQLILSKTAVAKYVFYEASPLIFAFGFEALEDYLSAIIVSRLGEDAIAASALISSSEAVVVTSFTAPLYAVMSLVSERAGAGSKLSAGTILQQGWLLNMLLSVGSVTILLSINPILQSFGQDSSLSESTGSYFRGYCIGVPAIGLLICNNQFLSGLNKQRVVLGISIFNLIIGSGLRSVLALATPLGLSGVGFAGAIRMWLATGVSMLYLYHDGDIKPYKIFNSRIRESLNDLKNIICLGWPIGIHMVGKLSSAFITTMAIGWRGKSALALHQTIQTYLGMFSPFQVGLSQAANALVGQAIGREDKINIRLMGNTAAILILVVTSFCMLTEIA